uniref:Uncharacterized protein AlNc14C1G109 n=1 Tax=Albugo laibachii Nc14 TaxID=890382 RepID=F0VYV8_9STRA|nr:conserved hypothetical protein [Albugo laibachii Nc14]|eukprot:CCA13973.1 conserved hypothetical protein [Albugo laibachii Nc14]
MQVQVSPSALTSSFFKLEQKKSIPLVNKTHGRGSTFCFDLSFNSTDMAIEERVSFEDSAGDTCGNEGNKDGIRLAEAGDWIKLLSLVKEYPEAARQIDRHGMLPLHWACTEDNVSPQVLGQLLTAYPDAALTRNKAHYLPIHIAVRVDIREESLRILCESRPSSLLEVTPSGKTAYMLAKEANLAPCLLDILLNAEQAYSDLTMSTGLDEIERAQHTAQGKIEFYREDLQAKSKLVPLSTPSGASRREHAKTSVELAEESSADILDRITFSGVSTQTVALGDNIRPSSCQLCYRKFGIFRRRYRCSRCLVMMCHKHVAGKLQVPNKNKKRFYCQKCFEKDRIDSLFSHTDRSETTALIPIRRSSLGDIAGDSSRGLNRFVPTTNVSSIVHHQIGVLEERNENLNTRVADQEKHHDEAMGLLTETMTRVAQIELRVCRNPERQSQRRKRA